MTPGTAIVRQSMKVLTNVTWGIFWGLCGAAVYCGYALILYVLRGSAPFEANGTTFWAVVGSYISGAIIVGILLGFLRPALRSFAGSAIAGFLCAIAVFVCIRIAADGLHAWSVDDLKVITILSLAFGPVGGVAARHHSRKLQISFDPRETTRR